MLRYPSKGLMLHELTVHGIRIVYAHTVCLRRSDLEFGHFQLDSRLISLTCRTLASVMQPDYHQHVLVSELRATSRLQSSV